MTTSVVGGTPKRCEWCEKEITRPAKISSREWAKIRLHRECVMHWRHHLCAKKDVPALPDRVCPACGKLLVRRSDEHWQAWVKRKSCGKSCAAMGIVRVRVPVVEKVKEEYIRVHAKRYIPGTPEFRQIAALYGG